MASSGEKASLLGELVNVRGSEYFQFGCPTVAIIKITFFLCTSSEDIY